MSNYNYKQYGDELRFEFCPICNEIKTNPDFTVNIKTGEYYCHSSGKGGNIKDLDNFDFDLKRGPRKALIIVRTNGHTFI